MTPPVGGGAHVGCLGQSRTETGRATSKLARKSPLGEVRRERNQESSRQDDLVGRALRRSCHLAQEERRDTLDALAQVLDRRPDVPLGHIARR